MTNQHMPKGGHAPMKYSGSPETFQHDPVGTFTFSSFPTGWFDFASVGPPSDTPEPSAVVIKTTDANGHITKALATLPAVAFAQGIFRPIDPTNHYATHADVRIDRFGDTDPTGAVEDPNNPGVTTHNILTDKMVFLTNPIYGHYDPAVDGVLDTETYMDSELTLVFGTNPDLNKPGLAVVDNIDTMDRHHGNAGGYAHGDDQGGDARWLDNILSGHR